MRDILQSNAWAICWECRVGKPPELLSSGCARPWGCCPVLQSVSLYADISGLLHADLCLKFCRTEFKCMLNNQISIIQILNSIYTSLACTILQDLSSTSFAFQEHCLVRLQSGENLL